MKQRSGFVSNSSSSSFIIALPRDLILSSRFLHDYLFGDRDPYEVLMPNTFENYANLVKGIIGNLSMQEAYPELRKQQKVAPADIELLVQKYNLDPANFNFYWIRLEAGEDISYELNFYLAEHDPFDPAVPRIYEVG
jgi:hypothetical protein